MDKDKIAELGTLIIISLLVFISFLYHTDKKNSFVTRNAEIQLMRDKINDLYEKYDQLKKEIEKKNEF